MLAASTVEKPQKFRRLRQQKFRNRPTTSPDPTTLNHTTPKPSHHHPFASRRTPPPSRSTTNAPPPTPDPRSKQAHSSMANAQVHPQAPLQQPGADSAASTESPLGCHIRFTPHPIVYPDLAAEPTLVCTSKVWHPKVLQIHPTQLLSSARALRPLQQSCLLTCCRPRALLSRPRRSIPAQTDTRRTSLLHGLNPLFQCFCSDF
jgi:hypothetical protein